MAHGIGRYWIHLEDKEIRKDEYVVLFFRVRNYYYEDMSDSYEPTWEWEDDYKVEVIKWRDNYHGGRVADHVSESVEFNDLDAKGANYYWWNFKNRDISFAEAKRRADGIEAERLKKRKAEHEAWEKRVEAERKAKEAERKREEAELWKAFEESLSANKIEYAG